MSKPTALITGFGPFPGVPRNASALLVPRLASVARREFPGWRIATAILPTEWRRAPSELARHHARAKPAWAIHFGVSREARGFVMETTGRNVCRDAADAAGEQPGSLCLQPDGPALRSASLPLRAIRERLDRRGLPTASSDDAGGYLCNAVLYHSLGQAEAAPRPARRSRSSRRTCSASGCPSSATGCAPPARCSRSRGASATTRRRGRCTRWR